MTTHERERVAHVLRTSRPPNPVNIILRMLRHVVIDYMTHARDVQPARRDIGRNHHFVFSALEALQRLDALTLRPI